MTIDKRQLPAAPGQIPDFTTVPREKHRHDGWTEERQRRFIEALSLTGSVKAAAHRVNMTPEGAYLLRRHPAAESFRKAWEAALALGVQQLEDIALERALHGTEVPVYSYGKLVGSRIKHNDRLLMFMLKNRAPTRFNAAGQVTARANSIGDPGYATELSRLKKKWRKEWEEEQVAERRHRSDAAAESINTKLEAMHQRTLAAMSPRTRRLYEAYLESQRLDEVNARRKGE
jgi:hypothetical protein